MPFLVVQIKEICLILFGYVSESLNMAVLGIDGNDFPPKMESVGGVSTDVFLFNFPA
jgi:hypothetical protein